MRRTKTPRPSRNRHAKARPSRTAGKRKTVPIAAELLAPMTSELEEHLRQLADDFTVTVADRTQGWSSNHRRGSELGRV
jgi:hypothetical protein